MAIKKTKDWPSFLPTVTTNINREPKPALGYLKSCDVSSREDTQIILDRWTSLGMAKPQPPNSPEVQETLRRKFLAKNPLYGKGKPVLLDYPWKFGKESHSKRGSLFFIEDIDFKQKVPMFRISNTKKQVLHGMYYKNGR